MGWRPRDHTGCWKCMFTLSCKLLWIKACTKWINVDNVPIPARGSIWLVSHLTHGRMCTAWGYLTHGADVHCVGVSDTRGGCALRGSIWHTGGCALRVSIWHTGGCALRVSIWHTGECALRVSIWLVYHLAHRADVHCVGVSDWYLTWHTGGCALCGSIWLVSHLAHGADVHCFGVEAAVEELFWLHQNRQTGLKNTNTLEQSVTFTQNGVRRTEHSGQHHTKKLSKKGVICESKIRSQWCYVSFQYWKKKNGGEKHFPCAPVRRLYISVHK